MNSWAPMAFSVFGLVLVLFIFILIWCARYRKVGPNEVLIVSGRKVQLPDGSTPGFRIVRGGGTFVLPVVEHAAVLSVEPVVLEFSRQRARPPSGAPVLVDGVLEFKVGSDTASITTAAENFLGKSQEEMLAIVRLNLEKNLGACAAGVEAQLLNEGAVGYATRVQAAMKFDLGGMGLQIISLMIRDVRAA